MKKFQLDLEFKKRINSSERPCSWSFLLLTSSDIRPYYGKDLIRKCVLASYLGEMPTVPKVFSYMPCQKGTSKQNIYFTNMSLLSFL